MKIPGMKIYRNADGGEGGAGGGEPWYKPLEAEVVGHLQTRGWDKKTPVEAVAEAVKAHRDAEKHIGHPADKIVRIPDERPTDTAETKARHAQEWDAIFKRLGKPADKKDYDFSGVKRTGNKPIDDALADTLRQAAFETHMSKERATQFASAVVKHLDGVESANLAEATDKLATEKAELNKNWGANAAANMVIAQGAVKALGVEPAAVAALEKVIGYAKVMDMFRNIGTKIGEDRFVMSGGGGDRGIMTLEQAKSEKQELMRDVAWRDRYLAGGREEIRKMTALDRIIAGVV